MSRGAPVNGRRIVYDAMGNPTTYKGNTFHWEQGRKLVSGTLNGNSFAYSYDGNGMRYEKEVDGTTTSYYYNGTQLLMESKEGQRTWYLYGVTGIEGMILEERRGESTYYFDKNTLGDVIAIRDESGSIVAAYEYDAWGSVTVTDEYGSENTEEDFIGNINPIRYRGYYYDEETGFYYLQTRYYDPSICRFINADDYEIVSSLAKIPGQLNLYTYCNNNPVMYTDPTGNFPWLILAAVLLFTPIGGTALQVVTSVVSYAGIAVASIFDKEIRNDMNAIGWNPFNSDESATLNSNKVSFYKGVPVFRTSDGRSGSFGAIFLAKGSEVDDLRHERGHNWQLMMMGIGTYGYTVGIPSPLRLGKWNRADNYYGAPWETMADILGGVQGRIHPKSEIANAWRYYAVSTIAFPFAALYWF